VAPRECRCELSAAAAAVDGTGRAVVSWRRDDGTAQGGGAASLPADGDRWEPADVPAGRLAAAPAVGAAGTAGTAAAWAIAGPGGEVRAARNSG
jgi:hypothetical protein